MPANALAISPKKGSIRIAGTRTKALPSWTKCNRAMLTMPYCLALGRSFAFADCIPMLIELMEEATGTDREEPFDQAAAALITDRSSAPGVP